jgi:hypothetical protein
MVVETSGPFSRLGIKVQTSQTFHNGCYKGRRLVKAQFKSWSLVVVFPGQQKEIRKRGYLTNENGFYSGKDPIGVWTSS